MHGLLSQTVCHAFLFPPIQAPSRPSFAAFEDMKFSKDLKGNLVERWEQHYIKYEEMKKLFKNGPEEGVEAAFDQMYNESLQIVNNFFGTRMDEYEQALSNYEQPGADGAPSEAEFFKAFREMGEFQNFIWINSTGFQKIMTKFDKRMQLRGTANERQSVMEEALLQELFMSGELEQLLDRAKKVNSSNHTGNKRYDLKLMAGTANPELAVAISGRLGIPLLKVRSNGSTTVI